MQKVSIVIPTFNSESTIAATLDSIARIFDSRIQIIIADGGSTDATLAICRNAPFPIDIHSSLDQGVYDAMNNAIARCNGKWVLFLGSDDLMLPGFIRALEKCVDPEATYYFEAKLTSNESLYGGKYFRIRLFLKNICHQAILYSRSFLESNHYDLRYSILADYDLNLRLFADSSRKKIFYPETISLYNNQTGMSSEKIDLLFKKDKSGIIWLKYGPLWWVAYAITALLINRVAIAVPFFRRYVRRVNQ